MSLGNAADHAAYSSQTSRFPVKGRGTKDQEARTVSGKTGSRLPVSSPEYRPREKFRCLLMRVGERGPMMPVWRDANGRVALRPSRSTFQGRSPALPTMRLQFQLRLGGTFRRRAPLPSFFPFVDPKKRNRPVNLVETFEKQKFCPLHLGVRKIRPILADLFNDKRKLVPLFGFIQKINHAIGQFPARHIVLHCRL